MSDNPTIKKVSKKLKIKKKTILKAKSTPKEETMVANPIKTQKTVKSEDDEEVNTGWLNENKEFMVDLHSLAMETIDETWH